MSSSRDQLILGLLAIQNGLINREQLVSAFSSWLGNSNKPLTVYLLEAQSLSQEDIILLERLAQRIESKEDWIEQTSALIPDAKFVARDLEELASKDAELTQSLITILQAPSSVAKSESVAGAVTPESDGIGQRIGSYKLLQPIGSGGMGTVWMAEQEQPVRRRVAIKLIKSGLDNRQIVARFEAERQALSMMDHPNIARVLDMGTTASGQPYFVMELVHGVPFTEYCDKSRLNLRERLELFVPVCHAIQHAHQKGIIHRDLKPSNILVAQYDGKPVPKVIDFGLAKATEFQTRLTDKTMFTEFGQVVGTIQYMSPEQAEMNAIDVDTRTDVYSLGVILYELLTGSTPIDRETMRREAILKILQSIRETEPPRPSARLSSASKEAVSSISEQRQMDPRKLQSVLRGELDWIVMKALEKNRNRRYGSANDMAQDLLNHLKGDPVSARPPSFTYQLQKLARKHRALVASTITIMALLLVAVILVSKFAYETDQARELAVAKQSEAEKSAEEKSKAIDQLSKEQSKTAEEFEKSEKAAARSKYLLSVARGNEGKRYEAIALLDEIPEKHRYIEWYIDRSMYFPKTRTFVGHHGPIDKLALSHDNTWLASRGTDGIRIWSMRTGAHIAHLPVKSQANSIRFTPDNSAVIYDHEGMIYVWDIASRQVRHKLQLQDGSIVDFCSTVEGSLCVLLSHAFANGDRSDLKLVHLSTDNQVLASLDVDSNVKQAKIQVFDEYAVVLAEDTLGVFQTVKVNLTSLKKESQFLAHSGWAMDEHTPWLRCLDRSGEMYSEPHLIFTNALTGEKREQLAASTFEDVNIDGIYLSPDGLHVITEGTGGARLSVHALPIGDVCTKLLLEGDLGYSPESGFHSAFQFTHDGTRVLAGVQNVIYVVNLFPTVVSKDFKEDGVRTTEDCDNYFFGPKDRTKNAIRKHVWGGWRYHQRLVVRNKAMLIFGNDDILSLVDPISSSIAEHSLRINRGWIVALCEGSQEEFFDVVLSSNEVIRCVLENQSIKEFKRFPPTGYLQFFDFYDRHRMIGYTVDPTSGAVTKVYDQVNDPPCLYAPTSNFIMDWNGRKLGLGSALNRKQFVIGDAQTGEIIRGYPWEAESKSSSSVQDNSIEIDGEYHGMDSNPDLVSFRVRHAIASAIPGYVIAMSLDEKRLILIDTSTGRQVRELPLPSGLKSIQGMQYFDVAFDEAELVLKDQANTYVLSNPFETWQINGGPDGPSIIDSPFRKRSPSSTARVPIIAQDILLLVQPQSPEAVEGWTDLSQPDPAWRGELDTGYAEFTLGGRIAKMANKFAQYYRFGQASPSSPTPLVFPYNEQGSLDYRKHLSKLISEGKWSVFKTELDSFVEHTLKTYGENPNHAGIVFAEQARLFTQYRALIAELGPSIARLVDLAFTYRQKLPESERNYLVALKALENGVHDPETEKAVWNEYLNFRRGVTSAELSRQYGVSRYWTVLMDFYKSQIDTNAARSDNWITSVKLATLLRDAGKLDELIALRPSLEFITLPLNLEGTSVESLQLMHVTAAALTEIGKLDESIQILAQVTESSTFSQLPSFDQFHAWTLLLEASVKAKLLPTVIDARLAAVMTQFELKSDGELLSAAMSLIEVATRFANTGETRQAKGLLMGVIKKSIVARAYRQPEILTSALIEMIRIFRIENDATHSILLTRILGFGLGLQSHHPYPFNRDFSEIEQGLAKVESDWQLDTRLPLTSKRLMEGGSKWHISYDEFQEIEGYISSVPEQHPENFQICVQAFALWKATPSLEFPPILRAYPAYVLDTRSCLHESLGLNSWLVEAEESNLWGKDEGGTRRPFQSQLPSEWAENANGLFLSHTRASEESVGWDKPRYDFLDRDSPFLLQGIPTLPSIFAHAPAKHVYQLGQKWQKFTGKVGIAGSSPKSSCIFEVLGDGKSLWKSARISGWDAEEFDIDVSNVSTLELVVNDAGDGNNNDWGCWFVPLLTRNQAVGMRMVLPPTAANRLNWAVWAVVQPTPNGRYSQSRYEQELMAIRKIVAQYPNGGAYNTLGVAEFRCGNYQAAIDACQKSIELQPKESGLEVPFPVDFAVVAMSHLKLGDLDKAKEHRTKMEQAMKSLTFLNNAECESFQAELEAALDAHNQTR